MNSIDTRHTVNTTPEAAEGLQLEDRYRYSCIEAVRRIDTGSFLERPNSGKSKSRRADGEVQVEHSTALTRLTVKLNSFSTRTNLTVGFCLMPESLLVTEIMLRNRKVMDGDDRSQFSIPRQPEAKDLILCQNAMDALCSILQTGSLRTIEILGDSSKSLHLFLKSQTKLPYFDGKFEICGLPSNF